MSLEGFFCLDRLPAFHLMTGGPSLPNTCDWCSVSQDLVRFRWTCLLTERMLTASSLLFDRADEWIVLLTQSKS